MTPTERSALAEIILRMNNYCLEPPQCLEDFAADLSALLSMKQPEGTVRVRIAVAVNPDGGWSASGAKDETERERMQIALDGCPDRLAEAIHWIEADIPLPVPQTIPAEVVQ